MWKNITIFAYTSLNNYYNPLMKPKYTNLTLLAVAALMTPLPMRAATYKATISDSPRWQTTQNMPSNALGMAVSADRIYTLQHSLYSSSPNGSVYYTSGNHTWGSFQLPGQSSSMIASDDDGNIIVSCGNRFLPKLEETDELSFVVLKAGAEKFDNTTVNYLNDTHRTVNIPAGQISSAGSLQYISASGDLFTYDSANPAYIYFYPGEGTNAANLVRAEVRNGNNQYVTPKTETFPCGQKAGTVASTTYPKYISGSDGEILINSGGSNNTVSLYKIPTTAGQSLQLVENTPYTSKLLSGTKVTRGDDRQFYIYQSCGQSGWNTTDAAFTVHNIKTGDEVTKRWDTGGNTTLTSRGIAMWVDAKFIDDNTIYVYCYMPNKGAWCYEVKLEQEAEIVKPATPTGITSSVIEQTVSQPGRQDASLAWEAVADAVKYRVYKLSYDNNDGAQTEKWSMVQESESTTFIEENITSAVTYKIAAVNADGIESEWSAAASCEPRFIAHIPEWVDLKPYQGYARAQLVWEWTYGYRPDAYDIYRDGTLIASDIEVLNYIDQHIPAGDRRYEIASVYYTYDDNGVPTGRREETARSAVFSAYIAPRNPANELYGLVEIYNYTIDPGSPLATAAALPDFTNQDIYRHGVYHKGKWYIAQLQDNAVYSEASEGGIICLDANAGSAEAMAASAKKILTYPKGTSVGLGIDEQSNFFIRNSEEGEWEFSKAPLTGRLVKFKDPANGDYTIVTDKTFALASAAALDGKITTRCDYYFMRGDVLNGEGYLYLSPTNSKEGWRVTIKEGEVTEAQCFSVPGINNGNENYMIRLDQRDDMLLCIRSNGYYYINAADHTSKVMYQEYSRINNAGGSSVWFNNDLFVITPQAQRSKNVGGFLVAKGTPDPDKLSDGQIKASSAADVLIDSDHVIPVASVKQDQFIAEAGNSNGIWLATETHGVGTDNPYVDIYLYVPAVRFAKYRLYPYINLPGVGVEMNVEIQYELNEQGENIDITSFKGTATWPAIAFEGDYHLQSYNLQITDNQNKVIEERYFDPEGALCDKDGNPVSGAKTNYLTTNDEGVRIYSYSIDNLDSREYTARVIANYTKLTDSSWTRESEPSYDTDATDYIPDAPSGGEIKVMKGISIWPDEDGVMRRNYRIDINFDKPTFDDQEQSYPVTHYEIWYRKPNEAGDAYPNRLTDLSIMNGQDKDIQHQETIPGTYDFAASRHPVVKGESGSIDAVCCAFIQPAVTDDGSLVDANDDPTNWKYVVRAKYAANARNTAIAKDAQSSMITATGGTTGVEDIDGDRGGDGIFPTVTNGEVTAAASTPITSITIYGMDGSIVSRPATNGEYSLTFNAGNLPAGIYLVSINGGEAHKLIVRH